MKTTIRTLETLKKAMEKRAKQHKDMAQLIAYGMIETVKNAGVHDARELSTSGAAHTSFHAAVLTMETEKTINYCAGMVGAVIDLACQSVEYDRPFRPGSILGVLDDPTASAPSPDVPRVQTRVSEPSPDAAAPVPGSYPVVSIAREVTVRLDAWIRRLDDMGFAVTLNDASRKELSGDILSALAVLKGREAE
ncbi:hypothetical protein OpiT1DRAFT_05436 [Opitutaceae bacterium TAV1]|nr:hypothetical protein OpiT1DRAFT_05436 [Opitutaceae bacterium TAV1]